MMLGQSIAIEPFDARHRGGVEGLFFSTSATQHFESAEKRVRFRERWLDRYLDHHPSAAAVAIADGVGVVGYVVGALADIALDPMFADIGYTSDLAAETASFPGHLHVNVADGWRGHGIGERLVARFADHARSNGVPGFHIVTAAAARNVAFYRRIGLKDVRVFEWNGTRLVMMGRTLNPRLVT